MYLGATEGLMANALPKALEWSGFTSGVLRSELAGRFLVPGNSRRFGATSDPSLVVSDEGSNLATAVTSDGAVRMGLPLPAESFVSSVRRFRERLNFALY